jgi:hypothetical protein
MGRGNWFPGSNLEDCEVVYVEAQKLDDEEENEFAWDDFHDVLLAVLPKSFSPADAYDRRNHSLGRDDSLIACNQLYCVWVDGQGEMCHLGVGITVRDDAPAFARSRLSQTARAIFDKLAKHHPLRIRCGAWTSAPYKAKELV